MNPFRKPGSRLMMIIDVTGASSYHGFLPTLVRTCIQHLTTTSNNIGETSDRNQTSSQLHSLNSASQQQFPLALATALFSFLYHLASYDSGGEALVACGMMESLLRVINWPGKELEHITFVTRAVRVIDLITNIEMQSFQNHGGLQSFIGRLEMEVNICREEQPSELIPLNLDRSHDNNFLVSEDATMYECSNPASNASSNSSSCPTTITSNAVSYFPFIVSMKKKKRKFYFIFIFTQTESKSNSNIVKKSTKIMLTTTSCTSKIDVKLFEKSYTRCCILRKYTSCNGKFIANIITTHYQ